MKKIFLLIIILTLVGINFHLISKDAKREKFNKAMLKRHNFYRGIAGIPKFKWNKKIEKNAQAWADKLKKSHECNMMHSTQASRSNKASFSYLGENLYWGWSSAGSKISKKLAFDSVDSWYNEIRDFQYSKKGVVCPLRGKKGAIGHFTQVMWSSTKDLGCGYAQCKNGTTTIVVCQYGPGGNFNQHVTPPFSAKARQKLHKHKINKKFGGLPSCD
jgi:uncharacterized protein YkwD